MTLNEKKNIMKRFVKIFSEYDENLIEGKINNFAAANDLLIISACPTIQKRVIDNDKMFVIVVFEKMCGEVECDD